MVHFLGYTCDSAFVQCEFAPQSESCKKTQKGARAREGGRVIAKKTN